MKTVSQKITSVVLLSLMLLATQSHHFMSLYHFPPAAFAVMFLGGFFLKRPAWFFYFVLLIALIDGLTISLGAALGAYFSWSYLFMVPAYGVLWSAGYWAERQKKLGLVQQLTATLIGFLSIFIAEAMASGSFYVMKTPLPHSTIGFMNYYLTWSYQSIDSFLFWALPVMFVYYAVRAVGGVMQNNHRQDGIKP